MAPEDTEMMAGQPEEQAAPGAYCIEIHVAADGRITVAAEPEEAETQEGEVQEPKGAPVANIKDALQVAMDIYRNNGQVLDSNAGEEAFAQGFASGPAQPQGPAKRFP